MYTGAVDPCRIQGERKPCRIQRQRLKTWSSWTLNAATIRLQRQLTVLRDSNAGMPPVMGTGKSYQHEMLRLLGKALLMVFFRGLGSFSSSP